MVPETYFTVSEELLLFLFSIALGAVLGVVYDIFRAIRSVFFHKAALVFVEDCIFFLIYALMLMCFAVMFSRSQVRFYYAIGNALGFSLYFFTIGSVVVRSIRKIVVFFRKMFSHLRTAMLKVALKTRKVFVKNAEIVRIDKKMNNNILQNGEQVLYNKLGSSFDNVKTTDNKSKRIKEKAEKKSGKGKRKKKG